MNPPLESATDPRLDDLRGRLALAADRLDAVGSWPAEQLSWCRDAGVLQQLIPTDEVPAWSEAEQLRAWMSLAAGCLSTTFVLTQPAGVARRLVDLPDFAPRVDLLRSLAGGECFATVGISHLTTSRRHVSAPVLAAREIDSGYVLDGLIPWVTGAGRAQYILTAATLADGRQVLLLLPTELPGVVVEPPMSMVALSSTETSLVRCDQGAVPKQWILAGPTDNVLAQSAGRAGTGGLQTSALAAGFAKGAIDYMQTEAAARAELAEPAGELAREQADLASELIAATEGANVCSPDDLRSRANSLAVRSAQAALVAAKGTGFLAGHPAGRWCREALFFLVWSCPKAVAASNLCELAGIEP